jgi:hypothetical protein
MSHADVDRTDVTARSKCGTDRNAVFRVKHGYVRAAHLGERIRIAASIKQFAGDANRRNVQDNAQVRCQAATPRMGDPVSVPQREIRSGMEFAERGDDRRSCLNARRPGM